MPWMRAMLFAVGMNGSVQMTAAGMPLFSNVIPSCKLLDEQEPQSPIAVMTTSHWATRSSTIFSGQGRLTSLFDARTTEANS